MRYRPAENPVQLRDLHATVLLLLGLEHSRLAVEFQGLQQKLTSVKPAQVVSELLA
ncbi:DUF1501 domain-containing protein [Aeoliella sp.]|uniref:DUF1501 domain-containing protein n=1 Tax=Aeoliella sp. TaxID=2795800 RepID=UPI003CCBE8EC